MRCKDKDKARISHKTSKIITKTATAAGKKKEKTVSKMSVPNERSPASISKKRQIIRLLVPTTSVVLPQNKYGLSAAKAFNELFESIPILYVEMMFFDQFTPTPI